MTKQKYELLSPVGDFEMLHSAIEAGANAVYLGLKDFNMRDGAKNFSLKDLARVSEICKKNKVKVYLTLNIIIYDKELKQVENILKKAKKYIDAVICWDLSVINLCKKYKIPMHISTQASISNVEAAKFYKKLGAERIVLARELSLTQIKKISKIMEIECFCHGAMCVSISGRCFTSQFLQGRSANRGQCTHPCRRAYTVKEIGGESELVLENNRVMSAKDLCTLPFIDKMKKAGITSFKIEGRNRSPEYVSAVTREYRRALDRKLSHGEIVTGLENLKKVYNRGFSSGFYIKMPTSDDFSFSEHGENTEMKELVGIVLGYWPNIGVANVKVVNKKLKIGDEIYLSNKDSAIQRIKIESMQIDHQPVEVANKGQEVGIKLPLCKKNDDVYLILRKRK